MTVLSLVLEALGRLAAFALGAWMAYTEATGTYEFYLAEQGSFNYIVKAAVGVTLASVLLPTSRSRAIKGRQWLLALAMLVGLVLSVSVILTAGVHRTSSVADAAKAEQREAKRKLDAAKANVDGRRGRARRRQDAGQGASARPASARSARSWRAPARRRWRRRWSCASSMPTPRSRPRTGPPSGSPP